MIRLIKSDGTTEEVSGKATLEKIQGLVGGYIESVPWFTKFNDEPCQVWCDEEGKLKHYPMNETATKLWYNQARVGGGDHLVGDIVILTGDDRLK